MSFKLSLVVCLCIGLSVAQDYQDYEPRQPPLRLQSGGLGSSAPKPTPIPILKQINRHNEDGSYTYGYEGADGSFKIETKLATGEVKGKYGYVDETGKVRVVEYGANKYGFQPAGEGITVAPPTLVDETTGKDALLEYEDEQPQQKQYVQRVSKTHSRPRVQTPAPRPQYSDYEDVEPQPRQQYVSQPAVPQRPHVPNAIPSDVVYSERPRAPRPEFEYTQHQTFEGFSRPASPKLSQQQPIFSPEPVQRAYVAPRVAQQQAALRRTQPVTFAPSPDDNQYVPRQSHGGQVRGSVLDQLAKDYALPSGGSQPLHDITFGNNY